MIYISGHKNPDTDSIMSAIVFQDFLNKKGIEAKAIAQGKPNKETKYALEYIGIEPPEILIPEKGSKVCLVDHNNKNEALDNLDELEVVQIVDHHAAKMNIGYPTYIRIEPIGCTCSILYKMFIENNIEIEEKIARCMLSAIISDSLLLKSPTCTDEDKEIIKKIEKIANLDMYTYGLDMLKAGTDISDLTPEEIINVDAKKMMIKDLTVIIAQINTADTEETLKRKNELLYVMNQKVNEEKLDLFMFAITDIINSNSVVLAIGEKVDLIEKSYDVTLVNNETILEGVVSRKKQIVPILTENA